MTAEFDFIGPYELIEPIGSGGFATVWAATDSRLDALVAVKVLAENHALQPEVRARFLSEARLLRRVDNPHLVTVHDVGETKRGQPYFVLDLADGGTLQDRVEPGVVRAADVAALADALHVALEAVHATRLVHRDIKPANILIKSGGTSPATGGLLKQGERFLLADFGFAKDLTLNSGFTVAGGTEHWSAPEQQRSGIVDARADVFAVGRVFEWIATQTNESWSESLRQAVQPSLVEDPEKRTISLGELVAAVHQAVALPGDAVAAPSSKLRWLGMRLGALVVALVVAAWVLSVVMRDDPLVSQVVVVDGIASATAELNGMTIILRGPATIPAGGTGRYSISTPLPIETEWDIPGVAPIIGANQIDIDGLEPGTTTISTRVTAAGSTIDLRLPITVSGVR